MDQTANGMSQGQDAITSSSGVTQGTQQQASQAPVHTSDERTFRQSEVSEIVKRAKLDAVDGFKRLQTEQPSYFQQKYGEANQQQPYTQPPAGNTPENEIRRMAAEEAQRLRDTWVQEARTKSEADQAQRIVQNFQNKVNPGREKYPDFDKVTGNMNMARFPNVVQLLGEYIENSGDVLYELGKDRIKLANLEQLAQMSPDDAIVQAQRLSQSLKDNEAATKVRMPNEPLSQLRPSNTGTDNGAMSVKDFRAKYKG